MRARGGITKVRAKKIKKKPLVAQNKMTTHAYKKRRAAKSHIPNIKRYS